MTKSNSYNIKTKFMQKLKYPDSFLYKNIMIKTVKITVWQPSSF